MPCPGDGVSGRPGNLVHAGNDDDPLRPKRHGRNAIAVAVHVDQLTVFADRVDAHEVVVTVKSLPRRLVSPGGRRGPVAVENVVLTALVQPPGQPDCLKRHGTAPTDAFPFRDEGKHFFDRFRAGLAVKRLKMPTFQCLDNPGGQKIVSLFHRVRGCLHGGLQSFASGQSPASDVAHTIANCQVDTRYASQRQQTDIFFFVSFVKYLVDGVEWYNISHSPPVSQVGFPQVYHSIPEKRSNIKRVAILFDSTPGYDKGLDSWVSGNLSMMIQFFMFPLTVPKMMAACFLAMIHLLVCRVSRRIVMFLRL